ncbi:Acid phosphatase [Pleurostoma richardsiae]|uniref:Acid phosphatase n=1 Tax=Pleurostoma richardsiae TaxID=41990 RepID=A0AA38VJJ7_9PEZI|nr:Acid phosphatase [Pleurostoma richardsiae]
MKFQSAIPLVVSAAFAALTHGLNILITNDDGFGTSNIRELYKSMRALGYKCYIVASTSDQSGTGGRAVFTTTTNLTADTEFAGAPSIGTDPNDSHIWYYNGTPAAQVFVALDYVLPNFANFSVPDLVLAGPNFGLNLGPFLYTFSGTLGAAYTAVKRGIPAIAYSASYSVQTPYYWTNTTTRAGLPDPATIYGQLAAHLAQALIDKASGARILPLGYGLSINMPYITSFANDSCIDPPFILTRMASLARTDKAAYNSSTGLFVYQKIISPTTSKCIDDECSLPGEVEVLASGCRSSVTVFAVDYDAPYAEQCRNVTAPYSLVPSIVQLMNSTLLVSSLGANHTHARTASDVGITPSSTALIPISTSSVPASAGCPTKGIIFTKAEMFFGIVMAMLMLWP